MGNKLKVPHRVLCFTDWLAIAYENSIGAYFGFLMCNKHILKEEKNHKPDDLAGILMN